MKNATSLSARGTLFYLKDLVYVGFQVDFFKFKKVLTNSVRAMLFTARKGFECTCISVLDGKKRISHIISLTFAPVSRISIVISSRGVGSRLVYTVSRNK